MLPDSQLDIPATVTVVTLFGVALCDRSRLGISAAGSNKSRPVMGRGKSIHHRVCDVNERKRNEDAHRFGSVEQRLAGKGRSGFDVSG